MSFKLQECVKPISYIKTNAADMMKYVNENKNSLVITQNGEAKAVLVDIESYQMMKDAFNLLKMIQISEKDIQNGKYKTTDKAFEEIRGKYKLDGKKNGSSGFIVENTGISYN